MGIQTWVSELGSLGPACHWSELRTVPTRSQTAPLIPVRGVQPGRGDGPVFLNLTTRLELGKGSYAVISGPY